MTTATNRTLALSDPALAWQGAVYWADQPAGRDPWRIDPADAAITEPGLRQRSFDAAGARLELAGQVRTLVIGVDPRLDVPASEPRDEWTFDLQVDGALFARQTVPRTAQTLHFTDLPAGDHRLTFFCYQMSPIRITGVQVDAEAVLRPVAEWPRRPRWIVYGSSITQCGQAAGPSDTWPARVAERHGLDHLSLGYGGNALIDGVSARLIARLPADYLSTCFGINVMGDYSTRTFRAAVLGFLLIVREGHPQTPLVCCSPIHSQKFASATSRSGITLGDQRELIADAVAQMQARGDRAITYVEGTRLFGPADEAWMPDQLHPGAEGCREFATRYSALIAPIFGWPERPAG